MPVSPARPLPPPWLRALATLAAIWIGLVFLFAGVAKALDPESFGLAIEQLGIGSFHFVPAGWGFGLGVLAIAVEMGLGAALLVGQRTRFVLYATVALLVFFMAVTVMEWVAGEATSCGCFGTLVTRSPKTELIWLVVYLVTLAPAFLARPARSTLSYGRGLLVGAATGLGLVLALAGPWLPAHAISAALGRVVPGVEVQDRDPRASLDLVLPELWNEPGRYLVVMTSFAEGPALEPGTVMRLNDLAGGWGLPVPVLVAVSAQSAGAEEDERYNELVWEVGLNLPDHRLADVGILEFYNVQWSLRGELDPAQHVPSRSVRGAGSFLPRSFLIDGTRVSHVWDGVPTITEVEAALHEEDQP